MHKVLPIALAVICVLGIITGLVSASNINNPITIQTNVNSDIPAASEAIEIISTNLTRKISSGQIQKYLPSFGYDSAATQLSIGTLMPLYTLYNTARDPAYCDALTREDFAFQSDVSEYGVFVYPSGKQDPILFFTFIEKDNDWHQSSMSTTAAGNGFGQNMNQYEKLAVTNQCGAPVVLWLFNDFALSFSLDGKQVVMPSTKMQHLLGLPAADGQPQVCAVDDFIERANEAISRFQNEKKTGQFSLG